MLWQNDIPRHALAHRREVWTFQARIVCAFELAPSRGDVPHRELREPDVPVRCLREVDEPMAAVPAGARSRGRTSEPPTRTAGYAGPP